MKLCVRATAAALPSEARVAAANERHMAKGTLRNFERSAARRAKEGRSCVGRHAPAANVTSRRAARLHGSCRFTLIEHKAQGRSDILDTMHDPKIRVFYRPEICIRADVEKTGSQSPDKG